MRSSLTERCDAVELGLVHEHVHVDGARVELFGPQEVEDGREQGGVPVDEDLQRERRDKRSYREEEKHAGDVRKRSITYSSSFILQSRDPAAQKAEERKPPKKPSRCQKPANSAFQNTRTSSVTSAFHFTYTTISSHHRLAHVRILTCMFLHTFDQMRRLLACPAQNQLLGSEVHVVQRK